MTGRRPRAGSRRQLPGSLASATALALVLLVASGCSTLDNGGQASQGKGCGSCAREVEQLRTRITAIPEVRSVHRLDYTPGKSSRLFPTLSLDLYVEEGSVDAVRVAVMKAAWLSHVTPLDEVLLDMKLPTGRLVSQQYTLATEADRKPYADAWGPRPTD